MDRKPKLRDIGNAYTIHLLTANCDMLNVTDRRFLIIAIRRKNVGRLFLIVDSAFHFFEEKNVCVLYSLCSKYIRRPIYYSRVCHEREIFLSAIVHQRKALSQSLQL